jgi:hypothetical protein
MIAAVLTWIGYEYLVVQIILGFIVLETSALRRGSRHTLTHRQRAFREHVRQDQDDPSEHCPPALLDRRDSRLGRLKTVSLYMLWVALALAFLSGAKQIYDLFAGNRAKPR